MINRETAGDLEQIIQAAGENQMEKMAAAFEHVSGLFIQNSQNRLELARAMGDNETAVKEQIMAGVMGNAREMFEYCYLLVTGSRRSLWDESKNN